MMIFAISLFLWLTFFGRVSTAAVVSGVIVSSLAQFVSLKLIPRGPVIRVAVKIILSLPVAIFQAVRLLFSRPNFSVRTQRVPQNRIEEFGEIISITMTPEEVVISEDKEGFIIHEVRR